MTPPATSAAAEGTAPAPGQRQERSWPPGTGTPQPLEFNFPSEVHVIIVIKQRGTHFGEQSTFLWRCYSVPTVFQHADSKGTPKRSFSIAQQIGKYLKRKKKPKKSKPDPWRTTRTSRPCRGALRGQRQKTHAALQNSPGEATKRSAAAEIGVCVSSQRILPAFLAGRLHFHSRADALYGVSPAASLIPPAPAGILLLPFQQIFRIEGASVAWMRYRAGSGSDRTKGHLYIRVWKIPDRTRNFAPRVPAATGKLCRVQSKPTC